MALSQAGHLAAGMCPGTESHQGSHTRGHLRACVHAGNPCSHIVAHTMQFPLYQYHCPTVILALGGCASLPGCGQLHAFQCGLCLSLEACTAMHYLLKGHYYVHMHLCYCSRPSREGGDGVVNSMCTIYMYMYLCCHGITALSPIPGRELQPEGHSTEFPERGTGNSAGKTNTFTFSPARMPVATHSCF